MNREIRLPEVMIYAPAAGKDQGVWPGTLCYVGVAEANAMGADLLRIEINPDLPDLQAFPDSAVAAIYPLIEFDLTCAGARELALALLAAADGADLRGRGASHAKARRAD